METTTSAASSATATSTAASSCCTPSASGMTVPSFRATENVYIKKRKGLHQHYPAGNSGAKSNHRNHGLQQHQHASLNNSTGRRQHPSQEPLPTSKTSHELFRELQQQQQQSRRDPGRDFLPYLIQREEVGNEQELPATTVSTATMSQPDSRHQGPSPPVPCWLRLDEGVHELAGEAGSGKTQIAMSLCVDAAAAVGAGAAAVPINADVPRSSCGGAAAGCADGSAVGNCHAIYVGLGSSNMSKVAGRMKQMVENRLLSKMQMQQMVILQEQHQRASYQPSCYHYEAATSQQQQNEQQEWMERILTKSAVNQDYLMEFSFHELPERLRQEPNVKVIVLDSIADLFRTKEGDSAGGSMSSFVVDRSRTLFSLAQQLKYLSNLHRVPIVVLNEVTASFKRGGAVLPALGLTWECCVNQSYLLKKCFSSAETADTPAGRGAVYCDGRRSNYNVEHDRIVRRDIDSSSGTVYSSTAAPSTTSSRRIICLHRSSNSRTGQTASFTIHASGVALLPA